MQTIITWDCIEILRSDIIMDKSIDLVLTDPPYKFEWHDRWEFSKNRKYLSQDMTNIGTNLDTNIYHKEFIDLLLSKLKTPNMIFFCNKAQIPEILDVAKSYKLNFDMLVLCKTAPAPLTNNQWLPDKEYAIHLHKHAKVNWDYHTKRTFRTAPNFKDTSINHPTVKPLNVIEQIVKNCSNEWDTILDPYLWSGTTAVAYKYLNRNCIWIEINPKYVEIANTRLQQQKLF